MDKEALMILEKQVNARTKGAFYGADWFFN